MMYLLWFFSSLSALKFSTEFNGQCFNCIQGVKMLSYIHLVSFVFMKNKKFFPSNTAYSFVEKLKGWHHKLKPSKKQLWFWNTDSWNVFTLVEILWSQRNLREQCLNPACNQKINKTNTNTLNQGVWKFWRKKKFYLYLTRMNCS